MVEQVVYEPNCNTNDASTNGESSKIDSKAIGKKLVNRNQESRNLSQGWNGEMIPRSIRDRQGQAEELCNVSHGIGHWQRSECPSGEDFLG